MTGLTPHDRPPYDVIAVFDPDGDLPSFAYTTGAFEAHGVPEVFVWATPDGGVDPGEAWVLSPSDQHAQLSDAVERLREGLPPEASWEHPLDGGRTVLRTTLVPAEDDLPTYALARGTPVRRLHLDLLRPPVGTPVPLTAAASKELVERTQRWADVILGHEVAVRTGLSQRYGPGTAGVQLLLELLRDADEGLLFCIATFELAGGGGTRSAFAELDAVARTSGRGPWVARAKADVDALLAALALDVSDDDRDVLHDDVGTGLRAAVTAWVVADLVDDELFRRATASVRAGVTRVGAPEDEEPAPPERFEHAVRLAADLAAGLVPLPCEDDVDVEALRAIWLMTWTGRGQALMDAAGEAGAFELLESDRVWELLAAALVLDVAPELVTLLPPQHRAA